MLLFAALLMLVAVVVAELLFLGGYELIDLPGGLRAGPIPILVLTAFALLVALVTVLFLYFGYRSLPRVREKRLLQREYSSLRREMDPLEGEIQEVEQTRLAIERELDAGLARRSATWDDHASEFAWRRHKVDVDERDEAKAQLRRQQEWFIGRGLASSRILDASIPGIGAGLKARMEAEGIESAADVELERVAAVRGLGEAKAEAVVRWRDGLEFQLDRSKPLQLPSKQREQVKEEYDGRRARLVAEVDAAMARMEDDIQAIERGAMDRTVANDAVEFRARERLEALEPREAQVAARLEGYAGINGLSYLTASLQGGEGRLGYGRRMAGGVVALVLLASLFCQGSVAMRTLLTMAPEGALALPKIDGPALGESLGLSPGATGTAEVESSAGVTRTESPSSESETQGEVALRSTGEPPETVAPTVRPTLAPIVSTAEVVYTTTPVPAATAAPTATPLGPGSPGADEVVAFNPGAGAQTKYRDAEALLGAPDGGATCCQGMVQLGRGGSVLLAFVDNTILDGPGPDFKVRGEPVQDDFLRVEVSADGELWYIYPRVRENSGGLDLAGTGLEVARFVRLTDLQPSTFTGAEVDAVIAVHSGSPEGELAELPDAYARVRAKLRQRPNIEAEELGLVEVGTLLSVLGRNKGGNWVRVRSEEGIEGWAKAGQLGLNVNLADYP